jgi:hypothetical protein
MRETGVERGDWRAFLVRWSAEWVAVRRDGPREEWDDGGGTAVRTGRLGREPASEERIRAAERRLGCALPPSYRSFLAVSDGWSHAGGFVHLLAGTKEVRWHEDVHRFGEKDRAGLTGDSSEEEVHRAGLWDRGLQLDVESDGTTLLLDPGDWDACGEWAVYAYSPWAVQPPERFPSFGHFMVDAHRQFHDLTASNLGNAFVNDTTRALDARVVEARLLALRGRFPEAEAVIAEARAYGRPRATRMHRQLRSFADGTGTGSPPEGTCRPTFPGPFGAAVDTAREHARWGGADAAWRALRAALPRWRPTDPDQLAPLELLADPVLGPVLTTARRQELLATPRGGVAGERPPPAPDLEPGGLAWLLDPHAVDVEQCGRGAHRGGGDFRLVLVADVEPAALPALLGGDEEAAALLPPVWEPQSARLGFARAQRRDAPLEDRALCTVGSAGPGWSFAFDDQPNPFTPERFRSPAVATSTGTRALAIWYQNRGLAPTLHLSVAEDGTERYAFTVRGSTVSRNGVFPAALDPRVLFPDAHACDGEDTGTAPARDQPPGWAGAAARALTAVAAEFEVSLPLAAAHGLGLHGCVTRSWVRPPGPGEYVATMG